MTPFPRQSFVFRRNLTPLASALLAFALALALSAKTSDSRAEQGAVQVTADTTRCRDAATWAAAQQAPLCSIAKAMQLAPSGGRILIGTGSYPALSFNAARSDWITIAADGSGPVTLPSITLGGAASYLSFQGLTLAGVAGTSPFSLATGGHHIQLLNSTVTGNGADGVHLLPGTSDILVQGNRFSSTGGGYGVVFASESLIEGSPAGGRADPPIARVTVRQNVFDHVDGDAIRPANFQDLLVEGNEIRNMRENGDHVDALQSVWGGTNLTFRGNYIHDNNTQGLFLKDGRVTGLDVENNVFVRNTVPCSSCGSVQLFLYDVADAKIINNTIWDNGTNVTLYKNVNGLVLRNNLIAYLDSVAASPDRSAGWTEDHNLIGGGINGFRGTGDIPASRPPKFVDSAHNDYRLKSGSSGIDAGSGSNAPALDKACRARDDAPVGNTGSGSPNFVDFGALEYRSDSTAADTAANNTGVCPGATPPAATPTSASPAPTLAPTTPPVAPQQIAASTTTKICTCPAGAARCRLAHIEHKRRSVLLRVRSAVTCRVRVSASTRWKGGHARSASVRRTIRSNRTSTLSILLPKAARRALSRKRPVTVLVTLVAVSPRGRAWRQTGTVTLKR
jgi:hypothetical protein